MANSWMDLPRMVIDGVGVFVCLVGLLIVIQAIGGAADLSLILLDMGFVAGLLVLGELFHLAESGRNMARSAAMLIGAIAITGLYAVDHSTLAVWLLIAGVYVSLVWLDRTVGATLFHNPVGRWSTRLVLAISGGLIPTLISQIESRFADEEFSVAVRGIELGGFCLLFLSTEAYLHRDGCAGRPSGGWKLRTRVALAGGFVSAILGLGVWGTTVYQSSFYAQSAPKYPGVTETSPFVCGEASTDPRRPSGEEVYRRLLARIEASPRKGVPELGMLALGAGELRWAEAFRNAILAEARAGRFTKPANSVKSTQYQAALRAYYASRVRKAFPDLFSRDDRETLQTWFAAINRRALTVEWVDWLYASAFAKPPEGPYENQENGAGLLAVLEAEGLSSPDLSTANRAYLERNRRGWALRFHNTDDAFFYQPEWITNAYFQSSYWQTSASQESDSTNQRLSFEWMLLQALPDGAPLSYNHPQRLPSAGVAYLAAELTRDPRFIWWSARMLDWAAENDAVLFAQPGATAPITLRGISPAVGSCLIYSDSGLPNQVGPLAPDKIVLRDGWTPDAAYMLLNLRFSGWHRYKATNNITLLYQDGPIVVEKGSGHISGWLPAGRSLFRDKRIPRENLNGLLIPRTGWSQVVHRLTGIGSDWAQDPPAYARVESAAWLGPVDVSRTVIDDWRGWTHARTVYFIHGGPIVVADTARGQGQAGIVWHLVGEGRRDEESLWLRSTSSPARMALSPKAWQNTRVRQTETAVKDGDIGTPNWDVVYISPVSGQLNLATVFTTGSWTSARYEIQDLPGGLAIELSTPDRSLVLLQNDSAQLLQTKGLTTDGMWALTLQRDRGYLACFAGGTRMQISLTGRPQELQDMDGRPWHDWAWYAGTLTVWNVNHETACVEVKGQLVQVDASGGADERP